MDMPLLLHGIDLHAVDLFKSATVMDLFFLETNMVTCL